MRSAIQQCCVQLKNKIAKQQAAREQRQRKKNLTKYIPNVAAALFTVLRAVAARSDGGPEGGSMPGGISETWALGRCVEHAAIPCSPALRAGRQQRHCLIFLQCTFYMRSSCVPPPPCPSQAAAAGCSC